MAVLGLLSTISGWRDNPALGPHSAADAVMAAAFVFGLWTVNIAMFFGLFAGVPWAILHAVGLRSWWIAPLAGFLVAFCVGFFFTSAGGYDFGLDGSASIDGRPTMIHGRLTPYGVSLYGTAAGLREGALTGLIGAGLAFLLWRIAYRTPRTGLNV